MPRGKVPVPSIAIIDVTAMITGSLLVYVIRSRQELLLPFVSIAR
jgi:hypothetical protein